MSGQRIYSEEEVARLIRRAIELEAGRSVTEDDSGAGLTISEIEQVAAEAGIDPELIQKAANELNSGSIEANPSKAASIISSDNRGKGLPEVRSNEIYCERWVDVQPGRETFNSLVMELNHRFGTSDEISWWDKLWDSYEGKAKIRRTDGTLEWHYTDEWQYYTTRVLMQKRGDRFRIRVSKRQSWGFNWESQWAMYLTFVPVFMVMGGILGYNLIDSAWLGIAAGMGLSLTAFPFIKMYTSRNLDKHKGEVAQLADDLAAYTIQFEQENRLRKPAGTPGRQSSGTGKIIQIESGDEPDMDIDPEFRKSNSGRLRNHLK
jgi:hypothetical protein